MPPRATFSHWSIEPALGWRVEFRVEVSAGERTDFMAVIPAVEDALLRLTPDSRGYDAVGWIKAVAQSYRVMGRALSVAQCGDLAGCVVEFSSASEWLRGWALSAGSFPLDVTYRCKLENVGRDDTVVDMMLSTLRLEAGARR
jgi:hypothetical protein